MQAFFPSPQTKHCIKLRLITGWHPLVVQHHQLPQHPSSAQPAPQLPGPTCSRSSWPAHKAVGRAHSPCGAVAEMLHSGHTWHCVVAKVWMNHLEAELLISTSGFPEQALPRMCLDCFFRQARRPPSRPGLLSHQIGICKHSYPCSQGVPSECTGACLLKKGACTLKKQPMVSLYSQKESVRQQEMGLLPHSSPAQPGMHSHSELSTVQGCGQLTGTILKQYPLQKEV